MIHIIMENKKEFHYVLSMGDYKLEDTIKKINHITFFISRYRKYTHTLSFDEALTEKAAIMEVEKWLSQEATEEYYNKIKDNLFFREYKCYGNNPIRGELLTDCKYLEEITYISYNHITFDCGS